jgi:hypothetical protein
VSLIFSKFKKSKKYPVPTIAPQKNIIETDFIKNPYKIPKKLNKKKLSIAFVSTSIGPGSGGHANITRFMKYLQKRGHRMIFYVVDNLDIDYAKSVLRDVYQLNCEVKNIRSYVKNDIVFATSWDTAYSVFGLKTNAHKMYFVQDFEPYFFPLGSHYVFAENTYKFGFFGLCAGAWLSRKLSEYGMRSDHYNFSADVEFYKPKGKIKKDKKILFYAQPSKSRRAFELGVMAFEIFNKKYPEYEIIFVGENTCNFIIPFPYRNMGVLEFSELPALYHKSIACLVLSLTNVSLLPLELLAAGCVPVLNNGDNNRAVLGDNNDIAYTDLTPLSISETIEKVVNMKNIDGHAEKISSRVKNNSWDQEYEKAEKIILREVS